MGKNPDVLSQRNLQGKNEGEPSVPRHHGKNKVGMSLKLWKKTGFERDEDPQCQKTELKKTSGRKSGQEPENGQ